MNRNTLLAHRSRGFPNVRATAGSQPNRAAVCAALDALENQVNDPQHVDAASRERVPADPIGEAGRDAAKAHGFHAYQTYSNGVDLEALGSPDRVSHLGQLADLLDRALRAHAFCLVPDLVSKQLELRGAHHLVREVWLSLCEASADAGPRSDKEAVFKRFVAEIRRGTYGAPEVLPTRGA